MLLAAHHPARLPLECLMTQQGWEEDQEQEVGVAQQLRNAARIILVHSMACDC
jgi:hypothetical protein